MIELLKLCGFESQEIESELPRVVKAFDKLGIKAEDIERGKQRLNKYYDMELEGVRKAFRLCLRELVDALLVREEGKKKLIYGFMAPNFGPVGSVLVSKSQEVFAVHHSWALQIVVGCIFDKIVPLMEAAEKKWLKAGVVAHCANVKTLLGPFALGLFPRPDLLVTTGFVCETSPKTLDLLHELYDIPVYCIDTCQDGGLREYSDGTKRITDLAAKSLRRFVAKVQEIAGFELTDEMLWEVIDANSRLNDAISKVKGLVASSDPLPLSPTHENIWMCLSLLTLSIDGIEEAIDAVNVLYGELEERVNKGLGVVEEGAPRILAVLPAGQTDPQLEHLVCEVGIAIVPSVSGPLLPGMERSQDPYVEMSKPARGELTIGLSQRISMIIEECKRLNVDGVLDRFHVGCRTTVGDAIFIEKAVQKELGIPVLLLEWENFDPRVHNHEEYKRRLEVFKAMMTKSSG